MIDTADNRYHPGQRIVIVGTTGSGKTTLAKRLSALLGFPHVELDALHWKPNWEESPLQDFGERVLAALASDAWIVDGNYSKVRHIVWPRADTIIWLDYSLLVIFRQLIPRTLRRITRREQLWAGNVETWHKALLSHDSILLWAVKSHRRQRVIFPRTLSKVEYAHLTIVRLQSPQELSRWLSHVSTTSSTQTGAHYQVMPRHEGD